MNHNEQLQKLRRLQNLLQELDVLESQIQNDINSVDDSSICLSSRNICAQQSKLVQTESIVQKKEMFANACQKSLSLFNLSVYVGDHKQLCNAIDSIMSSDKKRAFWKNVQSMIPQKSVTQVKEYYQKCFSRVKYEQKICEEDKNILKQLSILMKESKPAEVANCFMDCYKEKNYFKRTLVMFIMYLRK
ncbi:Hypothetical_protein [Hexamita inflata]|uniref:Hypothetical_protein n=1 Tax=Hexamita inflata TaxID=28002 RepID=A0AA86Q227_9EUKA|nr:Hypothetical protein HINF_LOCUS38315 [Hexamita inflata]